MKRHGYLMVAILSLTIFISGCGSSKNESHQKQEEITTDTFLENSSTSSETESKSSTQENLTLPKKILLSSGDEWSKPTDTKQFVGTFSTSSIRMDAAGMKQVDIAKIKINEDGSFNYIEYLETHTETGSDDSYYISDNNESLESLGYEVSNIRYVTGVLGIEYGKITALKLEEFSLGIQPFINSDGTVTVQRNPKNPNYETVDINKEAVVEGSIDLTFDNDKIVSNDLEAEFSEDSTKNIIDKSIYELSEEWSETGKQDFDDLNEFVQYVQGNLTVASEKCILPDKSQLSDGYTKDNENIKPIFAIVFENNSSTVIKGNSLSGSDRTLYAYDGKNIYTADYDELESLQWSKYEN